MTSRPVQLSSRVFLQRGIFLNYRTALSAAAAGAITTEIAQKIPKGLLLCPILRFIQYRFIRALPLHRDLSANPVLHSRCPRKPIKGGEKV
jgi:hypothetical protein